MGDWFVSALIQRSRNPAAVKTINVSKLFFPTHRGASIECPGRWFCLVAFSVLCLLASQARAQDGASGNLQFGINGHYRLGCWTAIRTNAREKPMSADHPLIVQTLDGDGMRVEHEQRPLSNPADFMYAVPGSEAAPVQVRGGDETLLSGRFPEQLASPSRGPSVVPLGMPWIVSLGDPLAVDTVGANELLNRDASVVVSQPEPAGFPDSRWGYDGVDLLMITSSGQEVLKDLNEQQSTAIKQWVLEGGRLFVTLGGSAAEFVDVAPWLFDLLPLDKDSVTIRTMDPSAIETYTSTQQPLDNFDGVLLPRRVGRILITGRTARRVSTPLAAEYITGLGRVTVIAADLDGPVFATWPDRLALVTRLTGSILVLDDDATVATSRATAFNDLAGQMRATLDQFPLKRSFDFSIVALILMALIAAIGPLDYLLINRVLGRPLLGWLSFPIATIALSALLISQARPVIADKSGVAETDSQKLIRCNRFEVVDIDAESKVGRGFAWSYLYSHEANRLDASFAPAGPLAGVASDVQSILTSGFGYPGRAFGGIQLAGEDARFPSYRVTVKEDQGAIRGGLTGLSLAPRSSKSIATRFSFTSRIPEGLVMKRRPGSELLWSGLINPFPFDLLDGMLIYRNAVYLLPTRFPSGGEIDAVDTLRQKNFRWQLSRQTALEKSKTESEAWVASRFDRPNRVAEMLLFHEAVGGSRYTFLRDDPLSWLDLSHLLSEDRCMLVGKLPESCLDMALTPRGTTKAVSADGQRTTVIRLMIPVQSQRR